MAETKVWKEGKRRAFKPDPNSTKNEWRFRLMPAKDFNSESFLRRKSQLPGISYIIGKRSGSDTYEVQSIRINKKKVRWAEAKKWWEENKDKFHFSNDHDSITPSKEKEVRHAHYIPKSEQAAEMERRRNSPINKKANEMIKNESENIMHHHHHHKESGEGAHENKYDRKLVVVEESSMRNGKYDVTISTNGGIQWTTPFDFDSKAQAMRVAIALEKEGFEIKDKR